MSAITHILPLESRTLFAAKPPVIVPASVAVVDTVLTISAAPKTPTVITVTTADGGNTVAVALSGLTPFIFSKTDIASVTIKGSRKKDRITIDETLGNLDLPLRIDASESADYVFLDRSPATVLGGDGDDTLYGSSSDDHITGNDGSDRIYGLEGDDTLTGGAGRDHLYGGNGDDQLRGERGNDYLDGGSGSDTLDGGEGRNKLTDSHTSGDRNVFYGASDRYNARNEIRGSYRDSYREIDFFNDRVSYSDRNYYW